ncbi:MAG: GNAT family N-acetyltransferase [Clostridia bacterium]|nr:GNAT family N-acetyltransferase [Clostridia bacterium]MBQ4157869.1 GNAT family N-acetyltransferase [Clostridia bacterium]
MYVRTLERHERIELKKLWSICFLYGMNVQEEEAKDKENADRKLKSDFYGCFSDDGKLVSGMAANHYLMNFDGNDVPLCGIGGVVTHPSYRNSGAIRNIFEKLLRNERESGAVFSGLYPFSHAFYRKFGYEVGRVKSIYTIPLSCLSDYACELDTKLLLPDEPADYLLPVYDAFRKRYSLSIERDLESQKHQTRSNPYEKNDFTYVIFENGEPIAYAAFSPVKKDDGNHAVVRDYAFVTEYAFTKLLGFFHRFRAQFTSVEIELPSDIPIATIVNAPYELSCTQDANYMIRVLNTQKALSGIVRDFDYRFVIEVTDDFLPENSGKFLAEPGKAENTDLPADVSMSIYTLSQIITGAISFEEALFKKDVRISGNQKTLLRVFTKKPCFTGIYY